MKKFILLSMIVASQFSLAGVIPADEAPGVMNAIVDASKESNLTCTIKNANGETLNTLPILESFLWSAFPISDEHQTQMLVNDDEQNPEITIRRKYPNATFVEETLVKTSADMTEVVGFKYSRYEVVVTGRKNTGTILKPNYVETKALQLTSETNCH